MEVRKNVSTEKIVAAVIYPRMFIAGAKAAIRYQPLTVSRDGSRRSDWTAIRAYVFGWYVGYRWQCWHYRNEH